MRKGFFYLFLCMMLPILADNVLLIHSKSGRVYAIGLDDIDSLKYDLSGALPDSLFNWTDTIHQHDTLSIYDTLSIHDTLTIKDTIAVHDTLTRNDTIAVHDTLTVEKTVQKAVQTSDGWHFNIENPVVADYMNAVDYSDYEDDYSYSLINEYVQRPKEYVPYRPAGALITWEHPGAVQNIILSYFKDSLIYDDAISVPASVNSYTVDNLYPGKRYDYYVKVDGQITKEGHFFTTGQVRMMDLPSLTNVRDLGGWPAGDGKRVKYGRIYRGAELNRPATLYAVENHNISSADSMYMVDQMAIRLEIDLRADSDLGLNDTISTNDVNYSALGDVVEYTNQQVHHYPTYMKYNVFRQRWANCISALVKCLKKGGNCYFHCVWGADRAGTLSMLILGTLGVPQAELDKEYELTSFSSYHARNASEKDYWASNMAYIKSLSGDTLKDKFATYLKSGGVTDQEIDDLRNIMLE